MHNLDWKELRSAFPACHGQTYLVTAAVGPLHQLVYQAYQEHIDLLHKYGDFRWQDSMARLEKTRAKLARLIDATPDDIGISSSTSHSMNLLALMLSQKYPQATIVMPSDEFPSSSLPWIHHGFKVKFVESEKGRIPLENLLKAIDSKTIAVLTSAVQYSTGYRQELVGLGEELKKRQVQFIVNATQALGAFPISVKKAQISALTASCHKWMGAGYGSSLFFTNAEFRSQFHWPLVGWLSTDDPIKMDNRSYQIKKSTSAIEIGIPPLSTLAGLDAACELILDIGVHSISDRILYLTNDLVEKLKMRNIRLQSYRESNSTSSGIVSIEAANPFNLEERLAKQRIFTNARSNGLRVSLHYYNDETDIDRLVSQIS